MRLGFIQHARPRAYTAGKLYASTCKHTRFCPSLQLVISCWLSCPFLFGLLPIYYWCNGALYLNAALPVTSTSAPEGTGKQANSRKLRLGSLWGRVSGRMNEWLGRWLSWSWTWPDTDIWGTKLSVCYACFSLSQYVLVHFAEKNNILKEAQLQETKH